MFEQVAQREFEGWVALLSQQRGALFGVPSHEGLGLQPSLQEVGVSVLAAGDEQVEERPGRFIRDRRGRHHCGRRARHGPR
jgi:hypothetical protein